MPRIWAALFLTAMILTACSSAPRPTAPVSVPTAEPAASASAGTPKPDAPTQPCKGPVTGGLPAVRVQLAAVKVTLPRASCSLTVPAGPVTLRLLVPNTQEKRPIKVTGDARGGQWNGQEFLVDLKVARRKSSVVTLDLSEVGGPAAVTYEFHGDYPVETPLRSSPTGSKEGPWTPVPESGLIPADHTWLWLEYPLPVNPGGPSPITGKQYGQIHQGLPGTWVGERNQYVEIGKATPILYLLPTPSTAGLQMEWHLPGRLYRGEPPLLQSVAPGSMSAHTLHRFVDVPLLLDYQPGLLRYLSGYESGQPVYKEIGLDNDQSETVPTPNSEPRVGHQFPSPDGKLVAELFFQGGDPGFAFDGKRYPGDLVIREQGTDRVVARYASWMTAWGSYSCSSAVPGLGWRADSQAVAVLDAPEKDRLVLKVADIKGVTWNVAEQKRQGAGQDQFGWMVAWAPSGSQIVFGSQVVDAVTGKVVAEQLLQYPYWSTDSRYLLLHEPDHLFTLWGKMELLEVATGKRETLGHGQGLGWTPGGEALLVRWDLSRLIPPPPKGCP